jgi:hypothetical protein
MARMEIVREDMGGVKGGSQADESWPSVEAVGHGRSSKNSRYCDAHHAEVTHS